MHERRYIQQINTPFGNIGNSVMNGIKEINTDTQTTKEDSRKHGYGLKNIKDVVDKYNGEISYEMRRPDYIMCRVELSLGKWNTIRVKKWPFA